MKRVKIMLSAIAVLATVGGALAFKARTYSVPYCVRAQAAGAGLCTAVFTGKTTINAAPGTLYFCGTTTNPPACDGADVCKQLCKLTVEP